MAASSSDQQPDGQQPKPAAAGLSTKLRSLIGRKPKGIASLGRPENGDKSEPFQVPEVQVSQITQPSKEPGNGDKSEPFQVPEVQVSQNTHPSEKPVHRDKSEGTAEYKTISKGKKVAEARARLCSSDNPDDNANLFVTTALLFLTTLQTIPVTTPQNEQPSCEDGPGIMIEKETQPASVDESEVNN